MKKLISIILLFIMVFAITVNTYAAELQKTDLNIGGIYLGQRIQEVFARYGQPAEVVHGIPNGRVCIYKINDGELRVSTTGIDDTGTVTSVKMTGDMGLAMESGIKFGSTAEKLQKLTAITHRIAKSKTVISASKDWRIVFHLKLNRNTIHVFSSLIRIKK